MDAFDPEQFGFDKDPQREELSITRLESKGQQRVKSVTDFVTTPSQPKEFIFNGQSPRGPTQTLDMTSNPYQDSAVTVSQTTLGASGGVIKVSDILQRKLELNQTVPDHH